MATKKIEEENAKTEQEVKKKRGRPKKQVAEKVDAEIVPDGKKKKGGVGMNGNLIPFNQRTESERRALSTKAGVASGEARRRKKELREFTKDFLMQDAAGILKQNMGALGVDADQMTNLAAMVIRLFSKAVNQGDLNSARTIIEWAGMAPLQQEQENAAVAKLAQVMELTEHKGSEEDAEIEDVVFYIPENGRTVIREEDLVTIE